jgi:hypothetical protein
VAANAAAGARGFPPAAPPPIPRRKGRTHDADPSRQTELAPNDSSLGLGVGAEVRPALRPYVVLANVNADFPDTRSGVKRPFDVDLRIQRNPVTTR